MPYPLYIALSIVLAFFIISALLLPRRHKSDSLFNPSGLYRRKYLLTINEKQQYFKLREITDRLGLLLFAKVRLIDIIEPKNPRDVSLVNRIIRKHCDFVILQPSGSTVAVVELDDNSHNTDSAKHRDELKDKILADASVPLLRTRYVTEELYNRLTEILSPVEKV